MEERKTERDKINNMAIPHIVFKQQAKKRLLGKEGKEREREVRKLLEEMPAYKTGPYGEIRKWLREEMQETRQRSKTKAKSFFNVRRQGDAQIVLLGPPNIGKSSLLKKLSSIQIKVADYEFTTLKPIPAMVNFGGAQVQIVEIPGLLQGASEGRGSGKAMLASARNANYLVLMTSVDVPVEKIEVVYKEVGRADLPEPKFLICNKIDLPNAQRVLGELKKLFPGLEVVPVSVEKNAGLEELKDHLWQNLRLMRIFVKNERERPIVVPQGAPLRDAVEELRSTKSNLRSAKIWGPSAKFPGQQVGGEHVLQDGDVIEV